MIRPLNDEIRNETCKTASSSHGDSHCGHIWGELVELVATSAAFQSCGLVCLLAAV